MRVSIPFQFKVGNATLPAGEYLVRQINSDSGAATLQISRRDGGANALINMSGAIGDGRAMTRLGFRCYGNQYYFGEVWVEGAQDGLQAPRSKAERATQKELAALNIKMETVALSAR
jgi:hypothetical protein